MMTIKKQVRFFLLLAGITASLASVGQQLHNGIVLPDNWPPRYDFPKELAEMPVPYLDKKPEVIPVNTGRQLFVDNFLIRETNLKPVFHTPRFYTGNPVLQRDKDWEKTRDGSSYAAPFSDGIWYDEKAGKFKLWYLAGAGVLHKSTNETFYTGYAESVDGKNWVKPSLDVYNNTNIVDTSERDASTVWLDKAEKDPAKRFKFFNIERRPNDRKWAYVLKYSADGIHWSKGVAQSSEVGDRSTAFFNPFSGKWALSQRYRTEVSSRSRLYSEHKDPEMLVTQAKSVRPDVPDKNVVYWFAPTPKEPRHPRFPDIVPSIYNFDAIAYESILLGQYSVWQGPENKDARALGIQKRNEILLGYSRDGFHFHRPSYKPFMGVNEVEGAWNWGNMQSINGTPLIVGDSLYFYSSGRKRNDIFWDSEISTGLATLRRDGFVSMRSEKTEGYLLTELLSFDGQYLFVNADVKGQLSVEVLDANGQVIPGFSRKQSVVVKKKNSTQQLITWKDKPDLSSLRTQPIRLRFYLTDGDLYAFWISPWETGESRGYTSGGGPGLHPSGVDIR
ncbi:hypothetical protein ACFPMF_13670 [Larkinella bovis]|uniref:Glycosyl hydrolase family 32 n=1 Tax=Larkinella bovis TaxID=683041 RepID=A0ABW0IA48_9BACT